MMMKCPKCGCQMREQEGYEDESDEMEMEDQMEGGEAEGKVIVKEVDVPDDKEEQIKKKLMELGKLMASIQK